MSLTARSHLTTMLVVDTLTVFASQVRGNSCHAVHDTVTVLTTSADDLRFASESKDDVSGGVVEFASLRVGVLSAEGSRISGDNSSCPTQD